MKARTGLQTTSSESTVWYSSCTIVSASGSQNQRPSPARYLNRSGLTRRHLDAGAEGAVAALLEGLAYGSQPLKSPSTETGWSISAAGART